MVVMADFIGGRCGTPGRKKRRQVQRRDEDRCCLCGSTEELTCDHKVPRCKGGSNDPSNLWTLCRTCNMAKADVMGWGDNGLPTMDIVYA